MGSVRRILSGELTNWKQLGGADEPIRVAYVQPGGGVTLSVGRRIVRRAAVHAAPIRSASRLAYRLVRVVEQEPRALGVAQLGLTQEHQLPELATNKSSSRSSAWLTLGEPSPEQQAVINAVQQVAASLGMPVLK